jgi:hypothetical protein
MKLIDPVTTTARTAGAVLLTTVVLGVGVPTAHASGGADDGSGRSGGDRVAVRTAGHCSASSPWSMKAKADHGRIEAEVEVDTPRAGRTWSVTLSDNGTRVFKGTRTTSARSGSFTLERRLVDRAGWDRLTAVARDQRSGERCVATLTFAG